MVNYSLGLLLFTSCWCASSVQFGLGQDQDTNFSIDDLFPSDVILSSNYIFIGKILNVTCTLTSKLTQKGYTSKDISFLRNDASSKTSTCFRPENTTKVDNKTSVLTMKVTPTSNGTYSCYVNQSNRCESGQLVGMSKQVQVDYEPQLVTNFSCMAVNWFEKLTCQWAFPVTYIQPSDVKVTFKYKSLLGQSNLLTCNLTTLTTCEFVGDKLAFSNYSVSLSVSNNRLPGHETSQEFLVSPALVVRPNEVNSFTMTPSRGCFHFSWRDNSYPELIRIKMLFPGSGPEHFEIVAENLTTNSFKKCDFPAYTQHRFCIEAFPGGTYNGFWSVPFCRTERTPMEAPRKGPEIAAGSYANEDKFCQVNNKRNITFYWKSLSASDKNGPLDGYRLVSGGFKKTVSSDQTTSIMEIDCDREAFVDIFAYNSAGLSSNPSRWHIDSLPIEDLDFKELQESFVASVSNRKISVSWNQRSPRHKKYLFWCKGFLTGYKCEGHLNWIEIESSLMNKELPVDASEASTHLYGISIHDVKTNASPGIFWTRCLLRDDAKILSPEVSISSGYDQEIKVTFSRPEMCSYDVNYKISGHYVQWCLDDKCEEHFLPYPEEKIYTIEHVTADKTYNVSAQTVTHNKRSEFTEPESITPRDIGSPPQFPYILIILIILLVFILGFLIYGCYYCQRRKKDIQKYFNEEALAKILTLPPELKHVVKEACLHYSSKNENTPDHAPDHVAVNVDDMEVLCPSPPQSPSRHPQDLIEILNGSNSECGSRVQLLPSRDSRRNGNKSHEEFEMMYPSSSSSSAGTRNQTKDDSNTMLLSKFNSSGPEVYQSESFAQATSSSKGSTSDFSRKWDKADPKSLDSSTEKFPLRLDVEELDQNSSQSRQRDETENSSSSQESEGNNADYSHFAETSEVTIATLLVDNNHSQFPTIPFYDVNKLLGKSHVEVPKLDTSNTKPSDSDEQIMQPKKCHEAAILQTESLSKKDPPHHILYIDHPRKNELSTTIPIGNSRATVDPFQVRALPSSNLESVDKIPTENLEYVRATQIQMVSPEITQMTQNDYVSVEGLSTAILQTESLSKKDPPHHILYIDHPRKNELSTTIPIGNSRATVDPFQVRALPSSNLESVDKIPTENLEYVRAIDFRNPGYVAQMPTDNPEDAKAISSGNPEHVSPTSNFDYIEKVPKYNLEFPAPVFPDDSEYVGEIPTSIPIPDYVTMPLSNPPNVTSMSSYNPEYIPQTPTNHPVNGRRMPANNSENNDQIQTNAPEYVRATQIQMVSPEITQMTQNDYVSVEGLLNIQSSADSVV